MTSRFTKIIHDWNDFQEALNLVQHQLTLNMGEAQGVESRFYKTNKKCIKKVEVKNQKANLAPKLFI